MKNLTATQQKIVDIIKRRKRPLTLKEIGRELGTKNPYVTVQNLVSSGILDKEIGTKRKARGALPYVFSLAAERLETPQEKPQAEPAPNTLTNPVIILANSKHKKYVRDMYEQNNLAEFQNSAKYIKGSGVIDGQGPDVWIGPLMGKGDNEELPRHKIHPDMKL